MQIKMEREDDDIAAGCCWHPYRPWLRWPIRLLGAVGIVAVLARLAAHHCWAEVAGLFGPVWLFLVSFDMPELKAKTGTYFIGAALAWLAVVFTLLVIGFWILDR
ncbi:MAG: hypothetical protein KA118_15955 [Verrucomicrobia bacterium]|nr:hypothetical protein [Verrucomicrobiota bacterium]